MTESAWLTLTRIAPMTRFALEHPMASWRQRTLFACACCRLAQDWSLPDLESDAIDATERHLDGQVARRTWLKRCSALEARDDTWERSATTWERDFRLAVTSLFYTSPYWDIPEQLIRAVGRVSSQEYTDAYEVKLCAAMRDIFGNPFQPCLFAPAWRTETVVALARQMYEAREFSAMPILADALQDAECTADQVLNHCRAPQHIHVRGCWVIDLVLDKN